MHNFYMRKNKKELVEKLLRSKAEGLTIAEIAKILCISRNTVAVAIAELRGAGSIRVRQIGMAKLNYWN